MSLKDLNKLAISSQEYFLTYKKEEVILTSNFKKEYIETFEVSSGDKISFAQYTTIIETNGGLTITFPNQWFFIASYFIDFLIALKEYKVIYHSIFKDEQNVKELIKSFKDSGEITEDIDKKISSILVDEHDKTFFIKFLTDYEWWFGSKTIDRGDYFVSPILSLAKVVNVSQSYIADLAFKLSDKQNLLEELKKSTLSNYIPKVTDGKKIELFNIDILYKEIEKTGLIISQKFLTRFVSSLSTKPFVILTGLSGSGKTKLAQVFAKWICKDISQFCIVPVGADWTNREPLLGYPNALNTNEYVKPDNGALDLIINANKNPELPYFLILDEMNLSHVERYFADFLSVMESKEEISLFTGDEQNEIPSKLKLPSNLFIIGTVNIDETTYMFSPKVLDRANVIEFRVTKDDIENFLKANTVLKISELEGKGALMAKSFLDLSMNSEFEEFDMSEINETLVNFFEQLKKTGAEFGYRSASEIQRLINQLKVINPEIKDN